MLAVHGRMCKGCVFSDFFKDFCRKNGYNPAIKPKQIVATDLKASFLQFLLHIFLGLEKGHFR
jgi:hypothetical protein